MPPFFWGEPWSEKTTARTDERACFAFEEIETGISAKLACVPQRSRLDRGEGLRVCWTLGRLVECQPSKVGGQHACTGHRIMTMLPD
ncbi:hypothetical protein [Mesorhizobium sp. M8A.F.Ca.ET.165.01.1.1]|uniref:hypothetical protein n=1 Tax=Mesorhizobium sp. M8A.F.Ca.ET.165.01.1.1 TaxID=2563960 RepID=UPI00109411B0|nr:hypothetical protein [Mesorhizobium sp. M8A.F.Ca.ET.165.01.1.1]TGT35827.1 hypothetical protein EN808_30975 [Mesorhizobium sp. M8A.F.Ca.ET.165.01.1.1]